MVSFLANMVVRLQILPHFGHVRFFYSFSIVFGTSKSVSLCLYN